ncbi:hypothetical protein B9479_007217 [Cryptococcus floricola]|uniref:Uncharacterized protein n=1 Tax=Cryptococcus floricola TaxID=2591691 RepID=A0A5D3AN08_9TREE|nr:hypothetical protein B9479_007217 [Cryptococcus floricola]
MRTAVLLALLPVFAGAAVLEKRSAEANVGLATSDVYPPDGTSVNSELFPPESAVGYAGPTPTGVEPAAAATASVYAYNDGKSGNFPLAASPPKDANSDNFDVFKYWGNLVEVVTLTPQSAT